MVVHGTSRTLQECVDECAALHIRAIQADVLDSVVNGSIGWELDTKGCGIGRHSSERHQDPTLVKPHMKWYVTELCEPLDGLIELDIEFH